MRIDKINNVIKKAHTIDLLGLISIGSVSVCYILFSSQFAELNIQLPFLDFPIFIGEILLFLCAFLFAVRYKIDPFKLNKWHYLLIAYVAFIGIKTWQGYVQWGPLALRDAALMYYFLFAVFGYYFYEKDFFTGKKPFFIGPLFILAFIKIISESYVIYWSFATILLAAAFITVYPDKKTRNLLWLLFLFLIPYTRIFLTSRMMIVSNTVAMLYLIVAFSLILRFRKSVNIALGVLSLLLFVAGMFTLSDPVRAKTIVSFRELLATFQENDRIVKAEIGNFAMTEIKTPALYQPEGRSLTRDYRDSLEAFQERREQRERARVEQEKARTQARQALLTPKVVHTVSPEPPSVQGEISVPPQSPQEDEETPVENTLPQPQQQGAAHSYQFSTGMNNAVFRLFIWRDMRDEFLRVKPLWGFDFGRPLRSISLEVLGWGWSNWGAQGWIPAHNSYFNIIYRAGIVGLLFLSLVFVVLFNMIREFIRSRSVAGILLCGVLINWLVAANFLMVLELPYTAIPIWSLYGITLAYCYKKEASQYELAKQKGPRHRR